ncbi:MAG: hypothetical protein PHW65_04030 [Dehalococcoidales bacterium]|nr:hypothetical protein [Dehalococcoidales bacterium]
MPNLILTASGWQERVRAKLGVDSPYLPDEIIEQPDIVTVAEAKIIGQVANYAVLTGTDRVYLEAATVCECAVLLCPSMSARMPTREQGPHFSHEIAVDWEKKSGELAAERDGYILNIAGSDTTLLHFVLAGPNR